MIEAVGSGQCEFDNFHSSVDTGLHGLGAGIGGRCAEDGAGADGGKGLEDAVVVFGGFGTVE